jgi:hypothetical protein
MQDLELITLQFLLDQDLHLNLMEEVLLTEITVQNYVFASDESETLSFNTIYQELIEFI